MSRELFKNNPHPLVEDHYHIQELIEAQQKRANERTNWQNQKKQEDLFLKTVKGFKDVETLDFFCTLGRAGLLQDQTPLRNLGHTTHYKSR